MDNRLGGYIAECYITDKETMGLRELVTHRFALVKMRTKIHSTILMKGVRITGVHPFTRKHIEELKGTLQGLVAGLAAMGNAKVHT